jgi:antitoxin (DNA-binding transcriptional repressor) of toxin-antitoxin stability system
MKTININQLQAQISRVMKDVEGGEVYEVMRYSRPIAIVGPKNAPVPDKKTDCQMCIEKMDKILEVLEVPKD